MTRKTFLRTIALGALLSSSDMLMAQSNEEGSSYVTYTLLAIAVIIFFAIVIQVTNSLFAVEAKQIGADANDRNFSLFPGFSALFAKKAPRYVGDNRYVSTKRGFDLNLEGGVNGKVEEVKVGTTFALQPKNFIGMTPIPKVTVEAGQEVKAGEVLFFDKQRPEIKYVAPVSGEIVSINRGEKRSIAEIVILADKEQQYLSIEVPNLETATREELVDMMLETGAWTLLRQRPYDIVPNPQSKPRDIFISTFDTGPIAPDLNKVVDGQESAFQKGLDVLGKLTEGSVFLGLDARKESAPHAAFADATGVTKTYFSGKHPIGNVGVQIHHTRAIGGGEQVWVLGVQEVITLGRLFATGQWNTERMVALTGEELSEPTYVRTYQGAKIGELLAGRVESDKPTRFISGDVLSGQKKTADEFLNFYDDQVTTVEEGNYYEMFGWLLPQMARPSISRTYPSFLFPSMEFHVDTNTHGEKRAFVVTGQYESVLPMDIYPQHLMKSILANDYERMEGLGIYELSEEDIAVCEYVCTSKQPLQQILRRGLDMMRDQS